MSYGLDIMSLEREATQFAELEGFIGDSFDAAIVHYMDAGERGLPLSSVEQLALDAAMDAMDDEAREEYEVDGRWRAYSAAL